jgi:hypothetical protein
MRDHSITCGGDVHYDSTLAKSVEEQGHTHAASLSNGCSK